MKTMHLVCTENRDWSIAVPSEFIAKKIIDHLSNLDRQTIYEIVPVTLMNYEKTFEHFA